MTNRNFWSSGLAILGLFGLASTSHAAQTPPPETTTAQPIAEPLYKGVRYERRTVAGPSIAHILHLDLSQPDLHFGLTQGDPSKGMEHIAKLTTEYLKERGAQVAINASYFLPFKGGSRGGEDYYPHVGDPVNVSGAEWVDGRQISLVDFEEDQRVDTILCFEKAKSLIVNGQICPAGYRDGVAAGPRLLEDGAEKPSDLPYAINPHPRTAFGLSANRLQAWIVVVDGRQSDSKGVTLPELTDLFQDLGASDAMNLDGGGSTTLAIEGAQGQPKLVNSPIHTGIAGRERPVANHILLFAPRLTNAQTK